MKQKITLGLLFLTFCYSPSVSGQNSSAKPNGPKAIGELTYKYVPSIKEQMKLGTFIPADPLSDSQKMGHPKLRHRNNIVPGKGSTGPDKLAENQLSATQRRTREPSLVFNSTNAAATPSDPTGAVGRDYYIAAWNTSWRIFNKNGTPATDAASLGTLFGGRAPGDPICLYDRNAERYIIMQFDGPQVGGPTNGFHIAISETSDPINGGWHTYSPTDFTTGGGFPDYQKISIWSDGYYLTANIGGGNGQVWALERDAMLNGDPAGIQAFNLPGISTSGFYSPQAFNVTNDDLPATGNATFVYMQDDAWAGVSNDHIKLWNLDIDWTTPGNSVMSAPTELPVTDYVGVFDGGSFANLTQPTGGPDIDCLQATIMNQAQFRKFPSYNSVVFNFVVDAGGSGNELAAIRWYELRQTDDGQPWSIHQEGTYTAPEGRHAWAGSMAMDGAGNIGMGYTTMDGDNDLLITSAYTGQFVGADLGVMDVEEEFIETSAGGSSSNRYADYTHLTLDPSDDASFWFVNEIFTPQRSNVVGVFQLRAPLPNDVGIGSIVSPTSGILTDDEAITISIRNFGTNPQSNIPVSYSINDGTPVNEVFTGTIVPGGAESFTFSTTADLSGANQIYSIEACASLNGDEDPDNDCRKSDIEFVINVCEPSASIQCLTNGIKKFVLGDIDAGDGENGCNGNFGYADRKEFVTDLDRSSGNNDHLLQAQINFANGVNSDVLSVWIDFNDNGEFEVSERLISGEVFTTFRALSDFTLTIPEDANLGFHLLRAKSIDPTNNGDVLDPCGPYDFGEVHDYTVNIVDSVLSAGEFDLSDSLLNVITKPNNQFEVILDSPISEKLTLNLYNMLGQQVVFNVIEKNIAGQFTYNLDMSYAAGGIYILKVGRGNSFQSTKIIVE
ncbi:MAG: GEVED domain-containing protein [Bacteroidota bacterium]